MIDLTLRRGAAGELFGCHGMRSLCEALVAIAEFLLGHTPASKIPNESRPEIHQDLDQHGVKSDAGSCAPKFWRNMR